MKTIHKDHSRTPVGKIILLVTLILFVIIFFYFQSIFLSIFMGVILALVINLPARYLTKKGLSKTWSLIIAIITVVILVLGILLIVAPALYKGIIALIEVLPNLFANTSVFYTNLQTQYTFLPTANSLIPDASSTSGIIKNVADTLINSLANIGGLITDMLIVLLISIFFLISPKEYFSVFMSLVPSTHKTKAEFILFKLKTNLELWIKTLGLSISVTFLLVWITLSLIGFPYAFAIALIAGLATFIPNVGAVIPLIPIFIFGITSANPFLTVWAAAAYILIQLVESNIITPGFMKANLNILPAGILIFQIIAAQLFGVLGVLLSVPILIVLIVLIQELYIKKINGAEISQSHIS